MAVKDSKEEVKNVKIELQMKIIELQIKLQPTRPPEVHEQSEEEVKVVMYIIEAIVKDCIRIFYDVMEIQDSLQEDLHMQTIKENIR